MQADRPRTLTGAWRARLLVAGFVVAVGLPSLTAPFGYDQSLFATVGQNSVGGKTIYLDGWDDRTPQVYWLYGELLRLGGRREIVIHLADLAAVLVSAQLLLALAGAAWGTQAGVLAGAGYGLWYFVAMKYNTLAECESFANPLLLGALFLLLRRPRSALWALATGVLLATAALLKLSLAHFLLLPLICVWLQGRPWPRVSFWLGGVLGLALVSGGTLAYLVLHGAFAEFHLMMTGFLPGYAHHGLSSGWHSAARLGLLLRVHVPLLVGLPALVGAVRRGSVETRALLIWALLAAASVGAQGRLLIYQFLPLGAGLATFAGAGFLIWWSWPRADARRVAWRGLLVALIFAEAGYTWAYAERRLIGLELAVLVGRVPEARLYAAAIIPSQVKAKGAPREVEVAAYLRGHTRPDETVFQFGDEPQLYWLSERSPASRFVADLPLVASYAPPEYRATCMRELTTRRPAALVIVSPNPLDNGAPPNTYPKVQGWPEFAALLYGDYALATRIGTSDIYLRRKG